MKQRVKPLWFSVIEILIAILIFSFWLVAVYMVIASSLRLNDYNKNFIIAANLAREEIEYFKNIRDVNYVNIHKWTQIHPNGSYAHNDDFFTPGSYYTLENDYSPTSTFPIKVQKISDFWEGLSFLNTKMQNYRLCLDSEKKYTYNCSGGNEKTYFYRFLKVEPLEYMSWGLDYIEPDGLKITAKVIWYQRGYNDTDISTIVTDWKRL